MTRIVGVIALQIFVATAHGQTNVLTYHNDNARTGQNTAELLLTPSNVNSINFGKLFSHRVDGAIYAQPLFVSHLNVAGGVHNVVIVATENDSVYAFDAENTVGANASPLWHANLIDTAHGAAPGATLVFFEQLGIENTGKLTSPRYCGNPPGLATPLNGLVNNIQSLNDPGIYPYIGITGTPVIDLSTKTLFVVAASFENHPFENRQVVNRLHAIDITTGNNKASYAWYDNGDPVSVKGLPVPASSQLLYFDNSKFNRPGLALANGNVYVAFGTHCDGLGYGSYTGSLWAFTEALTKVGSFEVTPNSINGGSIWMSGAAPAVDSSGNVFFVTANGDYNPKKSDYGDSIVKLNGTASFASAFTPLSDPPALQLACISQNLRSYPLCLSQTDTDLGSGGLVLLPDQPASHPHLLVQAGKDGTINVVDRDAMRATQQLFTAVGTANTQEGGELWIGSWGSPAYWNDTVYFWGVQDYLKAFAVNSGTLSSSPVSQSLEVYSYPGANLSISANGSASGIVWSIGNISGGPVLQAHSATNVSQLIYSSNQAANQRDSFGNSAVRFSVPTVANGRVYVAGQTTTAGQTAIQNQITAYGILFAGTPKPFLADVNGDGKADAVLFYPNGTWHVALSNGSSFQEYEQWNIGHGAGSANQFVADVNGDGKADAIIFDSNGG